MAAVIVTPAKPTKAIISLQIPFNSPKTRALLVVLTKSKQRGTKSGKLKTEKMAPLCVAWETTAANNVDTLASPKVPSKIDKPRIE